MVVLAGKPLANISRTMRGDLNPAFLTGAAETGSGEAHLSRRVNCLGEGSNLLALHFSVKQNYLNLSRKSNSKSLPRRAPVVR